MDPGGIDATGRPQAMGDANKAINETPIDGATEDVGTSAPSAQPNAVIVLDDVDEDEPEVNPSGERVESAVELSGNRDNLAIPRSYGSDAPRRPFIMDIDESNPDAKRYADSVRRMLTGSSSTGSMLPPPRNKVPHLRDLPDINKCGREHECGSLTQKERTLFTRFFEKHPKRIKITLAEGSSRFQVFAWSKVVGGDFDTVGYILNIAKSFKCEDSFISYLLHNCDSGSPRMEICFDKNNDTHYLNIKTISEERSYMKVFPYHSLGLVIRYYLFDA